MLVTINNPDQNLEGHYVLKLYDRRFGPEIRKYGNAMPWTPDIEKSYHEFLQSGAASLFFQFCTETDPEDLRYHLWDMDDQQKEIYNQVLCRRLYEPEVETYRRLSPLQGVDIPIFYKSVWVSTVSDHEAMQEKLLRCPSILIEYIDGFSLSNLANFAPREKWQDICDEAIRIVRDMGDYDIRNEEVRPRNFIVRQYRDSQGAICFKPVPIDFRRCVFRKDEDDKNWWFMKALQDEEGAIGVVMQGKLRGVEYKRSERSLWLQEEFMREDVFNSMMESVNLLAE